MSIHVATEFQVPIFERDVHLVCGTEEEIEKYFMDTFELDPDVAGLEACLHSLRRGDVPVWVLVFRSGMLRLNTIAHECFHLTCRMMKLENTPLNRKTEEMYALVLGHLMSEVLDRLGLEEKVM